MLASVTRGRYSLPKTYWFVAPSGCKTSLERLLQKPTELREGFLAYASKTLPKELSKYKDDIPKILAYAKSIDFGIFKAIQLDDMMKTHQKSPHHARRFNMPLPARPEPDPPPPDVADDETRYVSRLLDIYSEADSVPSMTLKELLTGNRHVSHFQRQRVSFYSAEALRVFAREKVPPGEFVRLQEEIYWGVVNEEEDDHSSGMARLKAVLNAAQSLQVTSSMLFGVLNTKDMHGICHQLCNHGRLAWIKDKAHESAQHTH